MPIVMVLASVQLDLDVNASRQLELHQRVHGFVVGVDNVQHALVRAGLVLVARIFVDVRRYQDRSEEHTSELQSLMRISYAVFCLKKKKENSNHIQSQTHISYHNI